MAGRGALAGVASIIAVVAAGAVVTTTAGPAGAAPAPSPRPTAKPDPQRVAADAKAAVQRDRALALGGPDEKYSVRDVLVDADGTRHVRLDRTYRGLPVLGGDFVVHAKADGGLRATTVAQDKVIDVPTKPAVSAGKAAAKFRGAGKPAATLVVDAAAGRPVLAWRVLVNGVEHIVDARTGAPRRTVDTVRTAGHEGAGHGELAGEVTLNTTRRDDGSYELVDPDRGGSETRNGSDLVRPSREQTTAFTDADNAWGDGTLADPATLAVDVQHGAQQTWDYFERAHGRNGIADDGRGALAVVHDRSADGNASWSDACFCMRFGAGDSWSRALTSQDIVAHEWSHGVTGATADLEYWGQSGALNESTSDIFGTLVEFAAANPADEPDYLVGELADFGGDGLPLRYMDDPARDGDSVGCWDGRSDDVHYLSGVPNKFFYMLAEGSAKSAWGEATPCGDAAPVTGIGREKAGAIWYHALTRYMVSTTDFAEARDATLSSAADLYGKTGAEYAAVAAAWTAVQVESKPPVPRFPVIVELDDQISRVAEAVRLQVEATDTEGERLRFTAEGLPEGLTISEDGLITGTPAEDRKWVSVVDVTDPGGLRDSTVFTWDVQAPPVIEDPGPQRHRVSDRVELRLRATDADYVTWSVTGLPDGLSLTDYGAITGSPSKEGTFEVTATATDWDGSASSVTFTWTVAEAPPAAPIPYMYAFWSGADVLVYWGWPGTDPDVIQGYEVTIGPDGPTVVVEDGWTTSKDFPGLDPAKQYTASIVAIYRDGRRSEAKSAEVWPE
ncbi:M4 family metallopeptidase [Actinoplanes sp. M2I2]|uniref:M4 family metallopeptidase n=1 Tax=Actinoplanes sp. M2I2 TaxID=1734444 RepID=UPI0020229AC2|nr:M4 family metallopeptidase [Actinoplanes sp. M2I2]